MQPHAPAPIAARYLPPASGAGRATLARPGARRRRWVGRLARTVLLVVVLLLPAAYAAASAVLLLQATTVDRKPLAGSPADVGLTYWPVTFESTGDRIPLQGWYLPATGERAVVM